MARIKGLCGPARVKEMEMEPFVRTLLVAAEQRLAFSGLLNYRLADEAVVKNSAVPRKKKTTSRKAPSSKLLAQY